MGYRGLRIRSPRLGLVGEGGRVVVRVDSYAGVASSGVSF